MSKDNIVDHPLHGDAKSFQTESVDLNADHLNVKDRLNLETAKIEWNELERHFARGVLIVVKQDSDLIKVATSFIEDDVRTVQSLKAFGTIRHANVEDAKQWQPLNSSLWAVVVSPWVLVQQPEF